MLEAHWECVRDSPLYEYDTKRSIHGDMVYLCIWLSIYGIYGITRSIYGIWLSIYGITLSIYGITLSIYVIARNTYV